MTFHVELPWPSKKLHPNARVHHLAKARAAKKARDDAFFCTRANPAWRTVVFPPRVTIPVQLTFHPPDRRGRDDDGMIAALKSARDGIADALEVDDNRFQLGAPRILEPVKNGKVIVEIG